MCAEDRGRLLLYFAAHVPGGLQTEDADLLLRLPVFPGIAHTSQTPVWRPLTGGSGMPNTACKAHSSLHVSSCLEPVTKDLLCMQAGSRFAMNYTGTGWLPQHCRRFLAVAAAQMRLCALTRCYQPCVVAGPTCQQYCK
jgi:hypothetical protein